MTGLPAPTTRRLPPTGSALVRALAALHDGAVPEPDDAFAQRLSRWFEWTDAIPLSAALHAPAATTPAGLESIEHIEHDCTRVKARLAALAEGGAPGEGRGPRRGREPADRLAPAATGPAPSSDDFRTHRMNYLATQRELETQIDALRQRLRDALSARSPGLARLAEIDAVMARVVGGRAQALLATVPMRLEAHFHRLRAARDDWRTPFDDAVRHLLRAELELRLQPVDGLLDALRAASPGTP